MHVQAGAADLPEQFQIGSEEYSAFVFMDIEAAFAEGIVVCYHPLAVGDEQQPVAVHSLEFGFAGQQISPVFGSGIAVIVAAAQDGVAHHKYLHALLAGIVKALQRLRMPAGKDIQRGRMILRQSLAQGRRRGVLLLLVQKSVNPTHTISFGFFAYLIRASLRVMVFSPCNSSFTK